MAKYRVMIREANGETMYSAKWLDTNPLAEVARLTTELKRVKDLARVAHDAMGNYVGETYDDEEATWNPNILKIHDAIMQTLWNPLTNEYYNGEQPALVPIPAMPGFVIDQSDCSIKPAPQPDVKVKHPEWNGYDDTKAGNEPAPQPSCGKYSPRSKEG